MKHIPVFFTFDNNYAVPAAIALWSLLNCACCKNLQFKKINAAEKAAGGSSFKTEQKEDKYSIFYDLYVLHSDITKENQNLILNALKKFDNFTLEFRNVKGFLAGEWGKGNFENKGAGAFTSETLLKCFAAKFFPEYDKIIYSDVDVVFADDISELYEIDIENEYIAAVKNAFTKYEENELSHLNKEYYEMLKDTYFAAGILVFNLKKIREDELEKKAAEIIRNDTIVKRYPDQDVLGIVCDNKVKFLPLNYISYPYLQQYLLNPDFTSHYTRDEMYDSIINPKIIHYAYLKPWSSDTAYKEIWYNIFNYLQLPKTSIFNELETREKQLEKKVKKYKRLYNIFLAAAVILFIVSAVLCLK